MSAYTGTYDGSQNGQYRVSCSGRWKPLELVAMILGFVVFWPIGLAILIWKIWQRKHAEGGDMNGAFLDKWASKRARWEAKWERKWQKHASNAFGCDWQGFASSLGGGLRSTGNLAFDDWRSAELARLEEERRKLEAAEQEFAAYMDNLRRAKDREEFDRFMQERRNRGDNGPTQSA